MTLALRRTTALALAIGIVATLGLALSARADASPFSHRAIWIWYVSKSGGNAKNIAKKAKAHGVKTVFIKSSDATSAWRQFTPGLIKALHHRGLKVCGWQFVYGDNAKGEAKVGAATKQKGADCLIIDAETSYEGRYAKADRYMTVLRKRAGGKFPIGMSSFPYVDYHPSFPYSVFFRRGGATANIPQVYWKTIGATVSAAFGHTYRWNTAYDRQIFPVGQTYENPSQSAIRAFRRQARSRNATGVSWWSWQETDKQEFNWLSGGIHKDPRRSKIYPVLGRGSKGDPVVVMQEYLKAFGAKLTVDGDFGPTTQKRLKTFQKTKGLSTTGKTNAATWRALQKRRPVPTKWYHGDRHRSANGRITGVGSREPKSASLPSRDEFHGRIPGRP